MDALERVLKKARAGDVGKDYVKSPTADSFPKGHHRSFSAL
jgi:hypothetical protein